LVAITNEGIQRQEIKPGTDSNCLAMIIISTLEGALMISRLERNRDALVAAQSHLDEYLEKTVRARRQRSRTRNWNVQVGKVVEATGVDLITMLTTRKLLIL
jgi:hypothetical protein